MIEVAFSFQYLVFFFAQVEWDNLQKASRKYQ